MSGVSKQADDAEKVRKELERALMAREDQIEQLENKHKVSINLHTSYISVKVTAARLVRRGTPVTGSTS